MALTRKFLQALEIESDKIDEIIEAHSATVDGLKKQRDEFEADAKELAAVKAELETSKKELLELKESVEKGGNELYKKQYEDLKTEYESYKKDQENKAILADKTAAYRALLKESGVSEKRFDAIMRITSLDDIELDSEKKIKNSDKLKETIKTEWADFIVKEGQAGANTNTPPGNSGGEGKGKSRAAMLNAQYQQNQYGTVVKGES